MFTTKNLQSLCNSSNKWKSIHLPFSLSSSKRKQFIFKKKTIHLQKETIHFRRPFEHQLPTYCNVAVDPSAEFSTSPIGFPAPPWVAETQLCWDLKIGFVNVFLSTIWKAPLLFLTLSTKTGASGKTNISSLWLCTSPAFSKVKGAMEVITSSWNNQNILVRPSWTHELAGKMSGIFRKINGVGVKYQHCPSTGAPLPGFCGIAMVREVPPLGLRIQRRFKTSLHRDVFVAKTDHFSFENPDISAGFSFFQNLF